MASASMCLLEMGINPSQAPHFVTRPSDSIVKTKRTLLGGEL